MGILEKLDRDICNSVYEYIKTNGMVTPSKIRDELGIDILLVHAAINQLIHEEKISSSSQEIPQPARTIPAELPGRDTVSEPEKEYTKTHHITSTATQLKIPYPTKMFESKVPDRIKRKISMQMKKALEQQKKSKDRLEKFKDEHHKIVENKK